MKSFVITTTNIQTGILFKIVRTIKELINSNLSAKGSKKEPNFVRSPRILANKPSRKSVKIQKENIEIDNHLLLANKERIKTGTNIILAIVKSLDNVKYFIEYLPRIFTIQIQFFFCLFPIFFINHNC